MTGPPGDSLSNSLGPRPVPSASSPRPFRGRTSGTDSSARATSTARLASPVSSSAGLGTPAAPQIFTPNQSYAEVQEPLPASEGQGSNFGPGHSALAAAIQGTLGGSPPRFGTPVRSLSPATAGTRPVVQHGAYGSFDIRSVQGTSGWTQVGPTENPKVVKRHLVHSSNSDFGDDGVSANQAGAKTLGSQSRYDISQSRPGDDQFSSLQLQGGDVTREVYRWTEGVEAEAAGRGRRSQSFNKPRPQPESDTLNIDSIKAPGGFRRNYIRRAAGSPTHSDRDSTDGMEIGNVPPLQSHARPFTKSFIEFLTLYGHFAGEELEEDDEMFEGDASDGDDYFSAGYGSVGNGLPGEGNTLLTPKTPNQRKGRWKEKGESGSLGAALTLVKSFVGTGVLFLPRAYLNGGMVFSNIVLLGVAALSYYCFVLLVTTRLQVIGSFGDIGGALYGKHMRNLILFSVVISQIGFVAAYIVFTSENLQAFVLAISKCKSWIDIKWLVFMQFVILLPFSLVRNIGKLGWTAFIADVFILLGLVYLAYYDIVTIADQGIADVVGFNSKDWTLFVGTAIFTFEGIGLIIPIQSSMRRPQDFPRVLAFVMIIITTIFVGMGALSYASYGSATQTVVLLNLPQDDKFVNAVQCLYSLAILLSTPLQVFPAIQIMEKELFTRSGKGNFFVKWQKNIFRFIIVGLCAGLAWGGAGDLDKFVSLVGSFACIPLVYVYPPLLHIKGVATTRWEFVTDCMLCVFGVIVMGYTTALTLVSWAGVSGPKAPGYCE